MGSGVGVGSGVGSGVGAGVGAGVDAGPTVLCYGVSGLQLELQEQSRGDPVVFAVFSSNFKREAPTAVVFPVRPLHTLPFYFTVEVEAAGLEDHLSVFLNEAKDPIEAILLRVKPLVLFEDGDVIDTPVLHAAHVDDVLVNDT